MISELRQMRDSRTARSRWQNQFIHPVSHICHYSRRCTEDGIHDIAVHHSPFSTRLAAKLIALPAAFFAGSYNFAFSQNAVPILYFQPSSVSTKVFAQVYYNGLNILAPVNVLGAAAFAYGMAVGAHDTRLRTPKGVLMGGW
ncbi:uncharacterized protein MYCFIDRAFT_175668 [Pseudocercospora fijiensis CIRAD86]|uniref:Uncharacterized protein n=1 Tax=Pseudocercospora fijiensis (strain CIRAD86) TaxID=383855 RepID=M3AY79_PSEFD|nr:uncharacterized protein MYCFIDRAFT_175668 [Pseudocercospora fijiensis CIRAD86]EME82118.1 hypothetical protein MYCFIDRAFT_175668 [Pseudocercospora fijiensis CIRAD86]